MAYLSSNSGQVVSFTFVCWGLLWSTTHSLFRAKLRSKRVSIHHLAGFQVADVSVLVVFDSASASFGSQSPPETTFAAVGNDRPTSYRRSKKSFLLYGKIKESCSIKTITPSIVLRPLEGLQRTFDYFNINLKMF